MTKKSRRFFYTVFQEVVILEVYVDIIFLENLLMDYILLVLLATLLRKKKKRIRLLAGAVFGGGYAVLYYVVSLSVAGAHADMTVGMTTGVTSGFAAGSAAQTTLVLCLTQAANLAAAGGMLAISFGILSWREWLTSIPFFYGLMFAVEGVLRFIQASFPNLYGKKYPCLWLLGMFLFGALFVRTCMECYRDKVICKEFLLPVRLTIGGKQLTGMGLLDSGNSLVEPITGKPVVLVEQTLLSENGISFPETGCFAIPYTAVGTGKGILKGLLADQIVLEEKTGERCFHKVMLGIYEGTFSKKGEYQVILHPKL